jgi:cell division protein FtsB
MSDLRSFGYTFFLGAVVVWGLSERLDALSAQQAALAAKAERNDLRAEMKLLTMQHDAEVSNAKYIVSRAVQDNRAMAEYVTELQKRFSQYASPLADCYTTGGSK